MLEDELTADVGPLRRAYRPSRAFLEGGSTLAVDRLEQREDAVAVTYRGGRPVNLVGVAEENGRPVFVTTYGATAARAVDAVGRQRVQLVYVAEQDAWFAATASHVTPLTRPDPELGRQTMDWPAFRELLLQWHAQAMPEGECATARDCAG